MELQINKDQEMQSNETENSIETTPTLVKQMQFVVVARKIKVLGIAIMIGLVVIYLLGVFVSSSNINKDLAMLNLVSLMLCSVLSISSVYIRKAFIKKVTAQNFPGKYFTAHIIAFFLCDAGGLFCITTNLFVNQNVIYASFGTLIALLYLYINFPKQEDIQNI
jgi:hypothetical protein